MFSVTRPTTFPKSLTKSTKDYRAADVVEVLQDIFFSKCYLCERKGFSDVNIEHRDPHEGDLIKKYDWNNLFYGCVRCNGIKANIYKNIIDCCQTLDVAQAIELHCPIVNNDDHKVIVTVGSLASTIEIESTIKLLDQCFNDTNTALKGISRHTLIKQIQKYQTKLLIIKDELLDDSLILTSSEKNLRIEKLKVMCDPEFPFSAFWKWYITRDVDLSKIVGNVF
ncbi:hypothetical protein J583_0938 [Acinetobacter baumannii 83444]|nr:hypothetical protein [Acinetobacter baumannii]EXE80775.1 hypothetical protein J583_0938 [Acinetobacter baumannii 83444]KRI56933.1 hypothetical protein APD18_03835 [Acinetobacter baumannii]